MLDTIVDFDSSLLLTINGWHNSFFDHFMYVYSSKAVWIPFYLSLWYVMFRTFALKQLILCTIGVALVIFLADHICSQAIRPLVERFRPSNQASDIDHLVHLVNNYRGGRYGFPSCHAANTFALTTYLFLLFRHRGLTILLLVWSLLTCYSRTYLGVHYPGDLLVGMLVGAAGAFLIYWLLVKFCQYIPPKQPDGWAYPLGTAAITVVGILVYAAFAS